jgi:hypothetical protein
MQKFELDLIISHVTSTAGCAYVARSKKRSAAAAAVVAGGQGKSQQLLLGAACGRSFGRRRAHKALHVVSTAQGSPGSGRGVAHGCALAVAAGAAPDRQQLGAFSSCLVLLLMKGDATAASIANSGPNSAVSWLTEGMFRLPGGGHSC